MRARTLLYGLTVAILAVPGSASAARQNHAKRQAHVPRQAHVVDGHPASNSQFPFIAALVTHGDDTQDGQFCDGSVIAPSVVLTAAHCMEGESPGGVDVVTGRTYLSNESAGQRIGVLAIRIDPRYNGHSDRHDAAVLVLTRPTSAPPVSIARAGDGGLTTPGAPLVVAGWGDLDNAGDYPDGLYAGALKAISRNACAGAWGSDILNSLMVCTLSRPGHRTDACDGDSGGPLVAYRGGRTKLVGIVSFGGDVCGDQSAPGVYTRASAEVPWIVQTLRLPPLLRLTRAGG